MDIRQYQMSVIRGMNADGREHAGLKAALGLVNKANAIKRLTEQGSEDTLADIVEELGHALWYLTYLAGNLGYGLDELAQLNYEGLSEQYPNRYPAL